MAVDEQARHELYNRLVETLGPRHTRTLMAHLPPVGWADVATKRDIGDLRAATKTDLDTHRAATKTDLDTHRAATKTDLDTHRAATKTDLDTHRAATKTDLDAHRAATKADLDAHRAATRGDLGVLRQEIIASQHETVATLRAEINAQTRLLFFSMLTVMLTAVALAFTAARFA